MSSQSELMNSDQQHAKSFLGNDKLKIIVLVVFFAINIKITLLFIVHCSVASSMFSLVGGASHTSVFLLTSAAGLLFSLLCSLKWVQALMHRTLCFLIYRTSCEEHLLLLPCSLLLPLRGPAVKKHSQLASRCRGSSEFRYVAGMRL